MLMCHVTLFVNTVAKNGRLEILNTSRYFRVMRFVLGIIMGIMVLRFYDTSVSNYLNPNKQRSGTVRSQTVNCFSVFIVVLLSGDIMGYGRIGVLSTGVCVPQ